MMFFASGIKYIGWRTLCSTRIASLGYFTNFMTTPYNVTISHPEHYGVASMTDQDPSATSDTFITSRYAG
jgi:hypothetical protein